MRRRGYIGEFTRVSTATLCNIEHPTHLKRDLHSMLSGSTRGVKLHKLWRLQVRLELNIGWLALVSSSVSPLQDMSLSNKLTATSD